MRILDILRLALLFSGYLGSVYATSRSALFDLHSAAPNLLVVLLFFVAPCCGYYLIWARVPYVVDSPFGARTLASVLAFSSTVATLFVFGIIYALTHFRFTD